MPTEPTHEEAERSFRELLAEGGIAPPDAVEREERSVVFYWHAPKLAVIVDLDDPVAEGVEEPATATGVPAAVDP